jgi:uncharacterized protein
MRFFVVAVITMLAITPALAQDTKASAESIKQLFELMHANSLLDNVMNQINADARAAQTQSLAGRPLNDEQRRILADTQEKVQSLVREELSWGKLEPTIIEVYRDNLTQKEVDGMLKFYRSESGRAFVEKMPAVMQEMMQKMRARAQSLAPKIMQLEKDSAARVKAAANPQSTAPPASQPPQPPQSPQPPPSH